jgi:hypothetical protein
MKKYILILIIVLGIGAIWYGWNIKRPEPVEQIQITGEEKATSTPVVEEKPVVNLTGKDLAWQTFQNYLSYNKAHNLEKVRSVIYKLSPVCLNSASTTECFARMDAAYEFGSKIKKTDIVNFWEDGKQAILSSEPKLVDDDKSIGYSKEIIYFMKIGGQLKLLRFYPSKTITLPKEGALDLEGIRIAAENAITDEDKDGLEDSRDNNPTKRDTDGDGLWDGTEAMLEVQ